LALPKPQKIQNVGFWWFPRVFEPLSACRFRHRVVRSSSHCRTPKNLRPLAATRKLEAMERPGSQINWWELKLQH
jgi:hypothetical protein